MRLSILLVTMVLAFHFVCAQKAPTPKKYKWKELLEAMCSADTTELYVGERDSIFIEFYDVSGLGTDDLSIPQFDKVKGARIENGRLVINRRIIFDYPKFSNGLCFALNDLHLKKPIRLKLENSSLIIKNSIFDHSATIFLQNEKNNIVTLADSKFIGQTWFDIKNGDAGIHFYRNVFDFSPGEYPFLLSPVIAGKNTDIQYFHKLLRNSTIYGEEQFAETEPVLMQINIDGGCCFTFDNNKFITHEVKRINFTIRNIGYVEMNKNEFSTNVSIQGTVNSQFVASGNVFKKLVSISDLLFPEHSQLDWNDLKSKLACLGDTMLTFKNIPIKYFRPALNPLAKYDSAYTEREVALSFLYTGKTDQGLLNEKYYNKMIEQYKSLFDLYKSKGLLKSSNAAFVAAKDLEGDRLRAIYKHHGGFKNYFSWKLNRLMKFYTNHATEPALALVVSVYILLGFAVFYFFFPSDWDIESKAKLLEHYRDFIRKNDKGYLKPFLKLTWGFGLSLINAITLSLNSFVTLGFGNIPTKGLARYVCIVQGFIGWFLLSIFTVALFNQVLF